MAAIQYSNVTKRFGNTQIIHGVDLDIEEGEFVVFVGPSGCGKSTLLRLLAGLESISDGEISIADRTVNNIDPAQRGVAMVFQSYALYPHMTVSENMGFGLKMNGAPVEEIEKRVAIAAQTLQLQRLLNRKPKDLSGGQRQRVAIGRAIVRDPKVFLFDEPLSNLDAELRVEMRLQLSKLHEELATTMIYVTHDQVEAMTLADKIVVLRSGRVEQIGKPMDLYYYPANIFVAGFIGSPKMNFIPVELVSQTQGEAAIRLPDDQIVDIPVTDPHIKGKSLTLGIRPEHMHLDKTADFKLHFQSNMYERLGHCTYLFGDYCRINGVKVQLKGDPELNRKGVVPLGIEISECHLFNESGASVRI